MAFSDHDQERIQQSIREAERHTRGEIVPMIVERSARYRETQYRAGAGCAFFTLSALITIEWEWMSWGWHATNAGWLLLAVIAAYGLGFWLGTFDPVIRLFTSNERMAYKVNLRAHQAFLEHGLHRTELGTGVLILISLLEHRIEILTDRAILDRVPPETWKNMLALIQEGFHKGNPVESLCQAITLVGYSRNYGNATIMQWNQRTPPNKRATPKPESITRATMPSFWRGSMMTRLVSTISTGCAGKAALSARLAMAPRVGA